MAQQLQINEFNVEYYFDSLKATACVEKKKYPSKVTQMEDFDALLVEAIDEGLGILGVPVRYTIYDRLARKFGIEKNQIPEQFDRFLDIMYMIFGLSLNRIEAQILKNLKNKLEIDYNLTCDYSYNWVSQESFKEHVENLRQTFTKQSAF